MSVSYKRMALARLGMPMLTDMTSRIGTYAGEILVLGTMRPILRAPLAQRILWLSGKEFYEGVLHRKWLRERRWARMIDQTRAIAAAYAATGFKGVR